MWFGDVIVCHSTAHGSVLPDYNNTLWSFTGDGPLHGWVTHDTCNIILSILRWAIIELFTHRVPQYFKCIGLPLSISMCVNNCPFALTFDTVWWLRYIRYVTSCTQWATWCRPNATLSIYLFIVVFIVFNKSSFPIHPAEFNLHSIAKLFLWKNNLSYTEHCSNLVK